MTPVRPLTVLSGRYRRALDIAAVVIVAGWQVAGAGSLMVGDRAAYGSFAIQLGAWLVLTAVIAAASVRLFRGWSGRSWTWALASLALTTGAIAAAACPAGQLLKTDWAWGAVGWAGVLVLLRQSLAELSWFLSVEALVTFGLLVSGGLNRAALAGFITIGAGSAGIQFAVAVAARALESVAGRAADAAQNEASARERAVVAAQVHAARQARWLALQATMTPLLLDVGAGTADPGNENVRRACAVEAARLRRMIAESDDTLSPLVHELQAAADVAERRGVAVDIEAAGMLPGVPAEIRRAITDAAIPALVAARSRARITLAGEGDGVAVSLVADAPLQPLPPAARDEVVIEHQQDGEDLWLQARWNGQ